MVQKFDPVSFKYSDRVYTTAELKKIVSKTVKGYPIDKVFLFGSYSRGQARPDSDIDLAVKVSPGADLIEYCALYEPLMEKLRKRVEIF